MVTFETLKRSGMMVTGLITLAVGVGFAVVPGCLGNSTTTSTSAGLPGGTATMNQVTMGRLLVLQSGCADCHSGGTGRGTPDSTTWLGGHLTGAPQGTFQLGPTTTVNAANISPDATGLAAVSERKIFNALKFGLDPMDVANPDAEITAAPAGAHYLAPVMPWQSFRLHTDDELWSIVAYLKHGIKGVANTVDPNTGDGAAVGYWAGSVNPAPGAFPLANESFNP